MQREMRQERGRSISSRDLLYAIPAAESFRVRASRQSACATPFLLCPQRPSLRLNPVVFLLLCHASGPVSGKFRWGKRWREEGGGCVCRVLVLALKTVHNYLR